MKSTKDLLKEKEMEEEAKEKKKAERRARDKEAAYQERLRYFVRRTIKRKVVNYFMLIELGKLENEGKQKIMKKIGNVKESVKKTENVTQND